MKFDFAFAVPATTLLLAFSAGSLALSANGLADKAGAARSALAKQTAAEHAAADAHLAVQRMPAHGTGAPLAGLLPITTALTGQIDAIGRIARAQSVEIERIATASSHPQGYAAASALTQEVPMTGGKLFAVRLSVHGTYGHYPEFKGFLTRLAQRGALQSIQLRANRFELTTEIYGVPDGV